MKNLLLFLVSCFPFIAFAQNYSNSWIDYSQKYYKFPIVENGIYRIDFEDLNNPDFPLATVDPQHISIFGRGKEIPLYIQGENDGKFDSTDYIEFYAQRNDGWLDSNLYGTAKKQPNPYYSLITDTAFYFITIQQSPGKRFAIENNNDFSSYFETNYVLKKQVEYHTDFYYEGEIFTQGNSDVEYVSTEGYMDNSVTAGNTRTTNMQVSNVYTQGPAAEFEIAIAGQSDYGGLLNGDHHLLVEFLGKSIDTIFDGFKLLKLQELVSPANISNRNSLKITSIDDLGSFSDRSALAYSKLIYPHTLDLENSAYFEFYLDDNLSQTAYTFNPQNFNSVGEPILYDLSNNKRIKFYNTFSGYKAVVPNGGRKKCVMFSSSAVKTVGKIELATENGFFTDYSSLAQDSAYLMLYHPSLLQEVNNYAAYRNNTGQNVVKVNVQELYDQFAYGIKKHPLAIRNFLKMTLNEWSSDPQYLVLGGKSISATNHRRNSANYAANLVPTMGNPPSDNLFSAGLGNTKFEAAIPTGRIAAQNNQELRAYLNKVFEYENANRAIWMKRAMHFAGGSNAQQSNQFLAFLNNYKKIYEDSLQGGKVFTFQKTQSIPIQTTLSDSIRSLVNQGVSLMTFFGHASNTGGFDISIDEASKFNNKGKYPTILANSCFSGNVHQPDAMSTSEEFVLEPNKGTIAFIASVNLSLPYFLNQYSKAFYENMSRDLYGKSMSRIMQQTVKDIQDNSHDKNLKSLCLEMSLHGDPALSFYSFPKPDYQINVQSISFNPRELSTEMDSFTVAVQIMNTGKAVSDSLLVELRRKYPDGTIQDSVYSKLIAAVKFSSTVDFTMPIDQLNGIGNNKFIVLLDPINELDELSESNNRAEVEKQIRAGSIVPIYPYRFSVVPSQSVTLKASTVFALEANREYVFELDTNASFSSPFKLSHKVQSVGGVVEWQPTILQNMSDSAVYFWRVSKVPSVNEKHLWKQSSFQFIPGVTGWAQDHFDQLKENSLLFLKANESQSEFVFVENVKELKVVTLGNPSIAQLTRVRYQIDSDVRERSGCTTIPAFFIAVLDSLSFESWETPYFGKNPNHHFGQANFDNYCGTNRQRPEKYFVFRTNNAAQMQAMQDFLNNEIPNGNHIVIYNWFDINFDTLRVNYPGVLQSIKNLGADSILNIPSGHPFIVYAQKGKPDSAVTMIGNSENAELELNKILRTSSYFGSMSSVNIGPATSWNEIEWVYETNNPEDSVYVQVKGIKQNGEEDLLFEMNSSETTKDISNRISASIYPQLKMQFHSIDTALHSAPQLDRWQVSYSPLPDAALNLSHQFSINQDTLQEGELLKLSIAVENVTNIDMDSLLISYSILDAQQNKKNISYPRQAPLPANSVFVSSIEIPTLGLSGENSILLEVNPNQDQPEQFHFNNLAQVDFFVKNDHQNPLLDVTFDGRHILNGEIVSAKPEILIQLEDNSEFLALDDTSDFSVYLTVPGQPERLLNFSDKLLFIPGKLPDNKAQVIYRPEFKVDGKYTLRVWANDKSGNASGENDYIIEFEIVTKSSITNVVNYPNPFTTSTRFVFTLTGSKLPDDMQIQIMTITGKVVKEISMAELGQIRIGNNISDYAWDGTDQFGDRLANGVYLYRIRTKMDGYSIEHRETASDQFFKKGYGKMYLMR